jgi:hypothetical protein
MRFAGFFATEEVARAWPSAAVAQLFDNEPQAGVAIL